MDTGRGMKAWVKSMERQRKENRARSCAINGIGGNAVQFK